MTVFEPERVTKNLQPLIRKWPWQGTPPRALPAREPQFRIGRAHARLGQAKLAAHDIGALDQRHAFVERDAPRQPLAPEAAIGADDQLLLRDVFECLADQR